MLLIIEQVQKDSEKVKMAMAQQENSLKNERWLTIHEVQ